MEKNNSLGSSLIETIASSEATGVAQDLAEIAIDSVLNEGLLKDIPIISWIVGMSKTILAIRDHLLIRKILLFLKGIDDIKEADRAKFLTEMNQDENYKRQIGEQLIMLLDRLDSLDKPNLIAKLFKAYLKHDITLDEFNFFSSIIDRIYIKHLYQLLNYMNNDVPSSQVSNYEYSESIYYVGLSYLSFDDTNYEKKQNTYRFGGSPTYPTSSFFFRGTGKPLQFLLTLDAFLMCQIILEKNVRGVDYIAQHKNRK